MQWNLDALLTGGVGAAVIASLFEIFHILMNKKVRTPADLASQRRADIVERNEMIDAVKTDATGLRQEVTQLKAELNAQKLEHNKEMAELRRENAQQENEIDGLREEAMARDHYIYRCLGTFHRLGLEEHIPQPTPFEKRREQEKKETEDGRVE